MKRISRQTNANTVAERWKRQYSIKGELVSAKKKEIHERLLSLGPTPDPDEVTAIIGNSSWVDVFCDVCEKRVDSAYFISSPSNSMIVCVSCLKETDTESPSDIADFRDKHGDFQNVFELTLQNCKSMEDLWSKASSEWLIWAATRPGVLDDQTLRKFACWCVRQIWSLLDGRCKEIVSTVERFLDGKATTEELVHIKAVVYKDASEYNWAATKDVVMIATWAAALAVARDNVQKAALIAANESVRAAILSSTLHDTANALELARNEQAKWLRENTVPNFNVKDQES